MEILASSNPSNTRTSAVDPATHTAVLQIICKSKSTENLGLCDLDWYPSWLTKQLNKIERNVLQHELRSAVSCVDDWEDEDDVEDEDGVDKGCSSPLTSDFLDVFKAVRKNAGEKPIDHIIDALVHDGMFKENDRGQTRDLIRENMVFAMLGWLSMLYVPSFDDLNGVSWKIHHDPTQPNSRLIYHTFEVNNYLYNLAGEEPAFFLGHFGDLLPARCQDLVLEVGQGTKLHHLGLLLARRSSTSRFFQPF